MVYFILGGGVGPFSQYDHWYSTSWTNLILLNLFSSLKTYLAPCLLSKVIIHSATNLNLYLVLTLVHIRSKYPLNCCLYCHPECSEDLSPVTLISFNSKSSDSDEIRWVFNGSIFMIYILFVLFLKLSFQEARTIYLTCGFLRSHWVSKAFIFANSAVVLLLDIIASWNLKLC